jgi:hypothetical protein
MCSLPERPPTAPTPPDFESPRCNRDPPRIVDGTEPAFGNRRGHPINPLEFVFGAILGVLFENHVARQRMDPATYTARRVKGLTRFYKFVYGAIVSSPSGGAWPSC